MDDHIKRVAVLGFDSRSEQALALAFRRHAQSSCMLCDVPTAHIVIADFDTQAVSEAYQMLRERQSNIPVIAVSMQRPEIAGTTYLSKPLSLVRLIELIETLVPKTKSAHAIDRLAVDKVERAMKAIDAKRAAALLEGHAGRRHDRRSDLGRALDLNNHQRSFDPARFLLGYVQTAIETARKTGMPAALRYLRNYVIAFDPKSGTVLTNLSCVQIRSLAISPCNDKIILPIDLKSSEAEMSDIAWGPQRRSLPAEEFLWNLGYLTSRGRLPEGAEASEPVFLRRWPNLTRLVVPPNAMRIIAYWVRQPCEPLRMHEVIGVPMEDVFAVYSAALAAGLAGPARRDADCLIDALDVPENRKRGVFSAILKRLGKFGEQNRGRA